MTNSISSEEWIKELIAVDTISHNSNLPLIQHVSDRLAELGVSSKIRPNAAGDKANLIATIPAATGSTIGGLVFSGHTDVVPVEGQSWTSDPFVASVRDGRIYGRGTADMKGFIGVALSMVPHILQSRLRVPIHFALSYDEEVGLHGGAQMLDDFRDLGLTPEFCVVGEPTGMRVIGAHKSFNLLTIEVRGHDGHSSLAPNLVSAAYYGAQMVGFIQDLAEEFQLKGPFDDAYDVPSSTISVNQIYGGSSSNTVPLECHIRVDFRTIMEVDPQVILSRICERARHIEAAMQAQYPTAGIEVSALALAPGLEAAPDSTLVAMLTRAGAIAEGDKVSYGTEAGFFHSAGIDTVVCGPGNITQAHIADEYVSLDQIRECERVLRELIDSLSEA
ncbi:Acetylornithine deacetylase [Rhodococcus wratislaviensis]|uniref:Acetylornithine deacetylase n=1 Tax=Rhodococcus wratislaviensis TaxID=44752 RepID=A0A402C2S1_RHOWR|nr:acetylornithine deacetylase [Rhodococcus wratislaviensis]GCE37866.1 Acetylornithine deacetylase [Rhodococcus wratislaviensis]